MNQYLFDLGNDQSIELDIINPAIDFKFRLVYDGVSGENADKMAPRETPVALFMLIVEDDAPGIDFGAAIRLIYNDGLFDFDPSTLSWYEFRSDKWREFVDPSTVSTLTKTVTQGFQKEALKAGGTTYLGVFGGKSVTFPADDYDYDMYDRYNVPFTVKKTIQNKYSFALPGKNEAFEMEILGADREFTFILTRPEQNPNPSAAFPSGTDTSVYFLTVSLQNNARPTYNAVFRYKYQKLPVQVDASTLQFAYFKGSAYNSFTLPASRNELSGVLTQGASSIDDGMPVTINLAIVGSKGTSNPPPASSSPSTPTPSPSPAPSPSPPVGQSSTPQKSPEPSVETRESTSRAFTVQYSIMLLVMALSIFALAHRLF